ncbi:MAG TPA: hypothetical protein PLZ08_04090 [Bacillota bacterium]|nr:hypothetical protein [Bacillota bacterium]
MILIIVILTGILFDIVGTAVTAAKEAPFHAMGADRVKGSREAIYLVRHADQVANFCNDVIGDIAGTISGALIVSIILQSFGNIMQLQLDFFSAVGIAFIAACTVGGKALGKRFAIEQANEIVIIVGKVLSFLKILKGNQRRKQKNKYRQKGQKRS